MNDRSKIKIVKKEDAPALKIKKQKQNRVSPRNAAREMVATVSDWVSEFKDRKSAETKTAIEFFRVPATRPSES